jgi:molecular chaperone DnaK
MAHDNKTLGHFTLDGLPAAPRGIPQIEVKFDIDANGILNVSATDKATNKQQKITITASSGLSKEEVEKMKKEAELHAEEDKKKKEEVEIKNQADAAVFTMEKMLKESGDKMKPEDKKELEDKTAELKKIKDTGSAEDLKKKMEEINTIAQKIGAAMYQQPGAGAAGAAGAGQTGSAEAGATGANEKKDDNVVEGEVEEKK